MKQQILEIIKKYLSIYPEEKQRLSRLLDYIRNSYDDKIVDWNNTNGHLTAGAFIYCKSENKFLVLFHKDLQMYLYPGGHVDKEDKSILETAKRELYEETGIDKYSLLAISNEELVPFDIDTHFISFNERVNMPGHYHFDFRYLFLIEKTDNIIFDANEFNKFKWISIDELSKDQNYGSIARKVQKLLEQDIKKGSERDER